MNAKRGLWYSETYLRLSVPLKLRFEWNLMCFPIYFFLCLTRDIEPIFPSAGTSPVQMLFPSFLLCISFICVCLPLDCPSPWVCLLLQVMPCLCPFIRWVDSLHPFQLKMVLCSNPISYPLLESNWVRRSKIIPQDNSTEVNTVNLTLCFPCVSKTIFL